MLTIVPDHAPNADAQWVTLDARLPACVTYLQERVHTGDVPPDELPERWRRTSVIFAPHIPKGFRLVRVDKTSDPAPSRPAFIVWNEARTEGYVTFDWQVAYEARKGAGSNCFDQDGTQMHLAQAFCEVTDMDNCTVQQVDIPTAFDPEAWLRR